MGNYLRKLAPGMSDENMERFATSLINTADTILKRWEYDKLIEHAQVQQELEDKAVIYKPGTTEKIIARIRPPGPKVEEITTEGLILAMGADGKIPLYMMDALSAKWKGKDLEGMKKQLCSFRNELEKEILFKKAANIKPIEEKVKIIVAPEMAPMGERDDIPYNWTVFGFLPRSREVMKEYIDKRTAGVPSKRLGMENWQFVLDMLIDTCDVLLSTRRMENKLKTATVEKFLNYDLYKDGSAGNIIGRIHFTPNEPIGLADVLENYTGSTRQNTVKKEESDTSEFMLKFGIDKTPGSVLSPWLLNRIPGTWTEDNIVNTKEMLVKMKEDSEYFHEVKYGITDERKDDIFPPKPEANDPKYGAGVSWTAFGHFARNKLARRNVISDHVSKLEGKMIKDSAIVYGKNSSSVVGQILPHEWRHTLQMQKTLSNNEVQAS